MKALLLVDEPNDKIKLTDVELPELQEGQLLIKLQAAALNRRDQWCREGKYPGLKYNTVLGSDGAGVVSAAGSDTDLDWIGKHVVINPNLNWGDNPKVQSSKYHILGMPTHGTLAEYVVVNTDRVHEKPSHLKATEAAAVPLAGLTAYRAAFHHGQIQKDQNVLISGAGGGVAQFAFQFALAAGANVYVTSGSEEKLSKCLEMGAEAGFNYKDEQWAAQAKEQAGGFDVVIDSAGGDQLNTFIKLMNPAGRIVFYGATIGKPKDLDLFRMFWNQITLQGSTMGNDEEFGRMLEFMDEHRIRPVVDSVRPFGKVVEAFDAMKAGNAFGKLVIEMPEQE